MKAKVVKAGYDMFLGVLDPSVGNIGVNRLDDGSVMPAPGVIGKMRKGYAQEIPDMDSDNGPFDLNEFIERSAAKIKGCLWDGATFDMTPGETTGTMEIDRCGIAVGRSLVRKMSDFGHQFAFCRLGSKDLLNNPIRHDVSNGADKAHCLSPKPE